ncbi:jg21034 [Pararge aegeria aegeria]|uniref:Jg21034 protein n=1 Tax=Pararge aegeria aegeria TaxID=348720 RepID=A0A8S4RTY5_9NEOP|nr:jg21034 [Pararge aegeria aegeria]
MFRGDNAHSLSYEQQAKFIQDRISNVEKNFGDLCVGFGDYTRKTARLRDMGDELAKIFKDYANNEIVNKSLSTGLDNLSVTLTAIEEYRNCEVQRLEAKTYAESELLKASAEMSRSAKGLSEQTEFFEKRKLVQLKTLLSDFVRIEMTFHSKAVELLSVAFQQIADINDRADLENFKRKLRSPEKQVSTGISVRSSSLASLMNPQFSPAREDDDSMSLGRLRSPEKNLSAKSRSLAALMNHSSSKDEEETTASRTRKKSKNINSHIALPGIEPWTSHL